MDIISNGEVKAARARKILLFARVMVNNYLFVLERLNARDAT